MTTCLMHRMQRGSRKPTSNSSLVTCLKRWTHFTNGVISTQVSFITILSVATGPDSIIDIKPNNILVNYGRDSARFSEVQLGDCGDTYIIDPNADPL